MHDTTVLGTIAGYLDALGVHAGFKGWWAFVLGVFSAALGGVGTLAVLLVTLMVLDYLLGFCRAWCDCRISSRKMRAGVIKFLVYAVGVFVVALADASLSETLRPMVNALAALGLPMPSPLRTVFMGWLCINEALSCIKHLDDLGLPVPVWLRSRLVSYRDVVDAAAMAGSRR